MAWLETCRIDAGKQIKHLKGQGLSIRQAIKKLARESGIPENTINNWIYERSGVKPVDAFSFMLDTLKNEYLDDGMSEDAVKHMFTDGWLMVLWCLLWLSLEEKSVRSWYRAAFDRYGRSAKVTDMHRTKKIWCNCPECDGKIKQRGKPHKSMNPELFTPKGYVNFNAI